METNTRRKPEWLKTQLPKGDGYGKVNGLVTKHKLHTICTSGHCPNIGECWSRGTATFMILGDICPRTCKFCNVDSGRPLPPDMDEPRKVAESVKIMGLKHCVITSVCRDDMPDGGAAFWAETIRTVKEVNPGITIETLIPDFVGKKDLLEIVFEARPDVISHNLETVKRLTPKVRSKAQYGRSLEVLRHITDAGIVSKSGIMLGIGEEEQEVFELMDDLVNAGVSIMTIGQYLQPSKKHLPVLSYIEPAQFDLYKKVALEKGIRYVESGPLVRSSYHAERHI